MSNDVEVKFESEKRTCEYCGEVHKTAGFQISVLTATEIEKLKQIAKNNIKRNDAVKNVKAGKIDIYENLKIGYAIERDESLNGLNNSSYIGEAEESCKCGAILKVKVYCQVLIKADTFEPTLDDFRKMKTPSVEVFSALMRAPEGFIPEDSSAYRELVEMDKKTREFTGDAKVKATQELNEKMQAIKTQSAISLEYLKSLIEPIPNLDSFVANTLEALDKIPLRGSFKNDFKQFLTEYKDDIIRTHNADFQQFINALHRLAMREVYGRSL